MMCRSVKPKRKGLLSELRSRLDTSPCIHAGVSDISAIIVPLGWRARVILSSLFLEYTLEGGQNRPLFEGSRLRTTRACCGISRRYAVQSAPVHGRSGSMRGRGLLLA